jgi:hypothetical protein
MMLKTASLTHWGPVRESFRIYILENQTLESTDVSERFYSSNSLKSMGFECLSEHTFLDPKRERSCPTHGYSRWSTVLDPDKTGKQ